MRKLEAAGFTHEQARALVELQEHGNQRGFERIAEHVDRRMEQMEARLRGEISGLRSEMYRAPHQQLFWFASMQTAIIAAVVLLVKLFV